MVRLLMQKGFRTQQRKAVDHVIPWHHRERNRYHRYGQIAYTERIQNPNLEGCGRRYCGAIEEETEGRFGTRDSLL